MKEQEIVWRMFECGGGARWTSTIENPAGEVCNFSGCNCGTIVKHVDCTSDRDVAGDWFRRPLIKIG